MFVGVKQQVLVVFIREEEDKVLCVLCADDWTVLSADVFIKQS